MIASHEKEEIISSLNLCAAAKNKVVFCYLILNKINAFLKQLKVYPSSDYPLLQLTLLKSMKSSKFYYDIGNKKLKNFANL